MKTKPKSLRVRETVESLDVIVARAVQEAREQGGLSPICAATFADAMAEYLIKRERILSGQTKDRAEPKYPAAEFIDPLTPVADIAVIDIDTN